MARKVKTGTEHKGLHDTVGLILIAAAMLLTLSLFTYDRSDLDINSIPPNPQVRNLIGQVGAWLGYTCFFVFGAAAYFVPALLLFVGLGFLLSLFSYLQRRWLWSATLLLACMGLLDLYTQYLGTLTESLNAPSAGGLVGQLINRWFFRSFGTTGATILFLTIYAVSFLYLTNFKLGEWIRGQWERFLLRRKVDLGEALNEDEASQILDLERRKRGLEKEQKKLEGGVEKTGLGPDLKPVPEPTIRDLSQPQVKSARKNDRPSAEPEEVVIEEVISAGEIKAATRGDILGKSDKSDVPWREDGASPISAPGKPKIPAKRPKPITVASAPMIGNYQLPNKELLNLPDPTVKPSESKEEMMANARLMQNTLQQFDIEVQLGDITKGPTITRYELHPAPGVKLEKISALTNNIAAALKAERLNILAPIPGKSSVGVEVPNLVKTKVIMRDLLESEEWQNTKAQIPLALGKDVYGHPIIADLAEMPHMLIAGSTGSGKSVCINSIIASLLYRFSPDQLRFVMIDPKVVELQLYNSLPHLVVPVVTDPKKVVLALRWVVNEMEKRYQIFAKVGVRNIKSFNERERKPVEPVKPPVEDLPLFAKKDKTEPNADGFAVELDKEIIVPRDDDIVIPDKLSYVVVIIDELADLMLVAPAEVEMAIARITQMARAAGIHCIVATQRPSVDVITGVIKANIPARIAFQVAAKVDSRTILDSMGADKLLGKGDMLYLPPGSPKLTRVQGVLITDSEIQSLVDFIGKQAKPSYEVEITQQLSKPSTGSSSFDGNQGADEDEELINQCIEVIRSEGKASVSLLQRRLRLGYGRAARIMDELEDRGIVGPNKGAEPRDILIDLDAGVPPRD